MDEIEASLSTYLLGVCRLFPGITPMNVRDLRVHEWVACCESVKAVTSDG